MSVLIESNLGDKVVVIGEFNTSPYKQPFSWKTAKTFKIGDKVKFCSWFKSEYGDSKLTSKMPMVLFEDHEGNLFSASAMYFATKEQYGMLQKHFQK